MKRNQPSLQHSRRLSWFVRVVCLTIAVILLITFGWRWVRSRADKGELTTPSTAINPGMTRLMEGLAAEGEIPVPGQVAWDEIDNPTRDGWTSEARSEQVQRILQELGQSLFLEQPMTDQMAARFCVPEFEATRLVPVPVETVFDDGLLHVERSPNVEAASSDPADIAYRGVDGFRAMVDEVADSWSRKQDKRFEFKVFRVNADGDRIVSHQYVAAYGRDAERSIESHSTWITRWQPSERGGLRLKAVQLAGYHRAQLLKDTTLFADCTLAALGANTSYHRQLLYGLNYWMDRNQDMRYFSPLGNPGLTVGDVNGDGLDDLYVCQEANLPNRLFLQQPDGTAVDVSEAWQVDWLESSRSALLLDLDNDGDQDLAVALLGGLLIASNEGNRFEVRDVLTTDDDTTSLSAADYDLDGDLDLYICVDYPNDEVGGEQPSVQVGAASRVYHDANAAGRNSLFRNEHSTATPWKFIDVTADSGLDVNNRRFSWAAAWDDFDNDGDQDLYVANDFGRNNLYANTEGRFEDVAAQARAEDSASGMSVAWADVDRDGLMDLYIANMFSSAGSRISHQPAFKQDAAPQVRARLQRFARGSTLLSNRPDHRFDDHSQQAGVTLGRWAWSSNFLDLNNDGWQDIAVANGYITSEDTSDL